MQGLFTSISDGLGDAFADDTSLYLLMRIMENRCIYITSTTIGALTRVFDTSGRRTEGLGITA